MLQEQKLDEGERLEKSELYAIVGTAMSMSLALHSLLIASHASLSFG